MSIQFEKKKMFFGQAGSGSKREEKDQQLGAAGYFTTAPASLPCAPAKCQHREVIRADKTFGYAVNVRCRDCNKTWSFSAMDLAAHRGNIRDLLT